MEHGLHVHKLVVEEEHKPVLDRLWDSHKVQAGNVLEGVNKKDHVDHNGEFTKQISIFYRK